MPWTSLNAFTRLRARCTKWEIYFECSEICVSLIEFRLLITPCLIHVNDFQFLRRLWKLPCDCILILWLNLMKPETPQRGLWWYFPFSGIHAEVYILFYFSVLVSSLNDPLSSSSCHTLLLPVPFFSDNRLSLLHHQVFLSQLNPFHVSFGLTILHGKAACLL